MNTTLETARKFFDACETGKGWEECNSYCHPDASFASQTRALADIDTLEGYTEWMKNLYVPVPDGRYELKCFALDENRNSVAAIAVFHGTHTGPGGPVPATEKSVAADYVYRIVFDGDRIAHMTKIWNDAFTMEQLGWA